MIRTKKKEKEWKTWSNSNDGSKLEKKSQEWGCNLRIEEKDTKEGRTVTATKSLFTRETEFWRNNHIPKRCSIKILVSLPNSFSSFSSGGKKFECNRHFSERLTRKEWWEGNYGLYSVYPVCVSFCRLFEWRGKKSPSFILMSSSLSLSLLPLLGFCLSICSKETSYTEKLCSHCLYSWQSVCYSSLRHDHYDDPCSWSCFTFVLFACFLMMSLLLLSMRVTVQRDSLKNGSEKTNRLDSLSLIQSVLLLLLLLVPLLSLLSRLFSRLLVHWLLLLAWFFGEKSWFSVPLDHSFVCVYLSFCCCHKREVACNVLRLSLQYSWCENDERDVAKRVKESENEEINCSKDLLCSRER